MNMTSRDLTALLTRLPDHHPAKRPTNVAPVKSPKRPMDGYRSKLERDYARQLEDQLRNGDILWWGYEPMRLRLADGAYYKPDFAVMTWDGALELHETKGFWREASRVRIKVAAERFPWRFIAVTRSKGRWDVETFAACANRVSEGCAVRGGVIPPRGCGTSGDNRRPLAMGGAPVSPPADEHQGVSK